VILAVKVLFVENASSVRFVLTMICAKNVKPRVFTITNWLEFVLLLDLLRHGEDEAVIDGAVVVPSAVVAVPSAALAIGDIMVLITALLVVLITGTDGIIVLMEVRMGIMEAVDVFGTHGELPHLLILKNLLDQSDTRHAF
jgi:hypothetical protein